MIRFIEIGSQIYPLPVDFVTIQEFAWFDTVTDTFMEFSDDQVWETWKEFEESFRRERFPADRTLGSSEMWDIEEYLERFRGLYPSDREGDE